LTDVDLNQYNDCFDDLNIKVYGMDVDHETILQQYIRKMKKMDTKYYMKKNVVNTT